MKRVVLVGAGHAHALVLQALRHTPLPNADILVISPQPLAPYSGMIPGWLAGRYAFNEICIDFSRLCKAAGARWLPGELYSLNPNNNCLQLTDGSCIDYDILSLNVGSTLYPPNPAMLAMRPLGDLISRYQSLLDTWQLSQAKIPGKLTVVGGGPAGFETLLAIRARLASLYPHAPVETNLITRSQEILPGHGWLTRQLALRALKKANVSIRCSTPWAQSAPIKNNELVVWAAGAQAHSWQRDPAHRGSLAVNEQNFVCVDTQLRSTSHPNIFAAGDCAALVEPVPKAGVYAVRMGPALTHNLMAMCSTFPARDYRPQKNYLALLNTSDGSAIASRSQLAASGAWAMRWKDRIDRRFITHFQAEHPSSNRKLC